MSLTDAINAETGSYSEVLAAVRARTVTAPGKLSGAELGGILLEFGLIPLIRRQVKSAETDANDHSAFSAICIGLEDRFKPNGEIDFSNPAFVGLIDKFLGLEGNPATPASVLLGAMETPIPPQMVKDAILAKATTSVPEFPNVQMFDVVAVKAPALAVEEVSAPFVLPEFTRKFTVTTAQAMPEPTPCRVEISYDGTAWQQVATQGLSRVSAAGTYRPTINHGPDLEGASVRVVSPYSVGLVLS